MRTAERSRDDARTLKNMGKSARLLGQEFGGLTGAQMNKLLHKHGYLYGKPGAWGLTQKGQRYGQEKYHTRGTDGSLQYGRQWETITWNEQTAVALRVDMRDNPDGVAVVDPPVTDFGYEPVAEAVDGRGDGDGRRSVWAEVGVAVVAAGALFLAPRVKRLVAGLTKK